MSKHKISTRPANYGPFSLMAFEHAGQVDIKYLELDGSTSVDMLNDILEDDEVNFKVGSFVFSFDAADDSCVADFEKACEKNKGIDYEYFFSSVKANGLIKKKAMKKAYANLKKIGDIAQKYGKFISMETHPPFCNNADIMLETMKNVDSPGVKINFDTANIYFFNELKPGEGLEEMKKVLPYIGSLHVKQTNGKNKEWYFPALDDDEGVVDFKEVFKIMDDAGFDGIYTIELEGTPDLPLKNMNEEQAKNIIKHSIDHLRACEN